MKTKKQRGFMMLELLMASIVIAGITPLAWMVYREYQFEKKSEFAGEHIARINRAVDAYVAQNADILTNAHDATKVASLIAAGTYPAWKANVPHIGVDPNPCTSGANPCVRLPIQSLVDSGFLTYADSQANNWGLSYDLLIKKTGTGQGARLDSMLATIGVLDRPEKTGPGVASWEALADAINKGGLNIGVVRTVTAADTNLKNGTTLTAGTLAAYGPSDSKNSQLGWVEKAGDWPNLTTEGQLVARAGYNASAWAAYLRLSGGQMTGSIDMNDNNIKNAKSISYSDSGIQYGAICGDQNGAAVADGVLAVITPSSGGTINDSGTNRFGAGATAQWTPAAGSNISAQTLQCLYNNASNTYRWAKPGAAPLTVDEIKGGMMDGWVTSEILLCGVGANNTLADNGAGTMDTRNLVRFKIEHRAGQANSGFYMQVWMGPIDGLGRTTPADAYSLGALSNWVDLDAITYSNSYFSQTAAGMNTINVATEPSIAASGRWALPWSYSLPGPGTVCISGFNNVWNRGGVFSLSSYASSRLGDARAYGMFISTAGLNISSTGVNFSWAPTVTMPVVTDDLASQGQQQASGTVTLDNMVTGVSCGSDPVTGASTGCGATLGSVSAPVALPVSRGYSTTSGVYPQNLVWQQREQ